MKGYKVFNPDWTCRGFQFEVGKTYKHDGELSVCNSGFHFCQKASDCFNYYSFDINNKVAEVEALGRISTDGDKSATDEIRIIREIPWSEVLDIVNTGKSCTGLRNSGNWNSGNRNSGDWNSGFFNSTTPKLLLFNKPTDLSYDEVLEIRGIKVLNRCFQNNWWIDSKDMSEDEKSVHPDYEATSGYLKVVGFKEACAIMWRKISNEDKEAVKAIPNFDPDVFEEITGIRV